MDSHTSVPSVEEFLARILPPSGHEGCVVVEVQGHYVWMKRCDLKPTDAVCFFDGDCRSVLSPDDPLVRNFLR
jgi:hypothetical protein